MDSSCSWVDELLEKALPISEFYLNTENNNNNNYNFEIATDNCMRSKCNNHKSEMKASFINVYSQSAYDSQNYYSCDLLKRNSRRKTPTRRYIPILISQQVCFTVFLAWSPKKLKIKIKVTYHCKGETASGKKKCQLAACNPQRQAIRKLSEIIRCITNMLRVMRWATYKSRRGAFLKPPQEKGMKYWALNSMCNASQSEWWVSWGSAEDWGKSINVLKIRSLEKKNTKHLPVNKLGWAYSHCMSFSGFK